MEAIIYHKKNGSDIEVSDINALVSDKKHLMKKIRSSSFTSSDVMEYPHGKDLLT